MTTLTKRVAALACAMLMTAGGISQVSAGAITFYYEGAKVTGSAVKTGTTTASATTQFSGKPSGSSGCTVNVCAYVKVNGTNQYGAQEYTSTSNATATVTGTIYVMSGFGGTGYGGHHSLSVAFPNASGGVTINSSGIQISSYYKVAKVYFKLSTTASEIIPVLSLFCLGDF